jgi:hypothetical protein
MWVRLGRPSAVWGESIGGIGGVDGIGIAALGHSSERAFVGFCFQLSFRFPSSRVKSESGNVCRCERQSRWPAIAGHRGLRPTLRATSTADVPCRAGRSAVRWG